MEKSAERCSDKFKRLLIACVLFFIVSPLFARPPSWAYMWSLRFKPMEDVVYTSIESSFAVEIANVTPDTVQLSVNSLPQNVSFLSSRKETVYIQIPAEDGGGYATGTKVIITMIFSKTGTYRISPIDLTIEGGFYRIPFETVEVFENPLFITPETMIEFDSAHENKKEISMSVGEKAKFTVYAKFLASVKDIYWTCPEDCVLKEVERFDATFKQQNFFTEYLPVATFEWQPLKEGSFLTPDFFITASLYNGNLNEIKCASRKVTVKKNAAPSVTNEKKTRKNGLLKNAFEEAETEKHVVSVSEISDSEAEYLASLYQKEVNSFPYFSSAYRERCRFEKEHGLIKNNPLGSKILLLILFVLCIILLVLCVVIYIFSTKIKFIVLTVCFSVCVLCTVLYSFKVYSKKGVYTGRFMYSIPEENVPASVIVKKGNLVQVERDAGAWIYVSYNKTYGWIKKKNVHLLK